MVDRQGPGLVTARALVRRCAVLEVLALGLEIPPARRDRRHAVPRLLGHVEDGAALRAVEPLVAVGGEDVDPGAADVRRKEAEALDPVDEEEDAALAAEGADLPERKDETVVEGDPGDGDDPRPLVDEGRERLERDASPVADGHAAVDAPALERAPGVGVGGELHVVGDDVVPRAPRKPEGDEVDRPGSVREERDLLGRGADEPRRLRPGLLDVAVVPPPVRDAPVPDILDVRDDRVGDAARQGRGGRMVEVDEVAADGELAVEVLGREVEAHRAASLRYSAS